MVNLKQIRNDMKIKEIAIVLDKELEKDSQKNKKILIKYIQEIYSSLGRFNDEIKNNFDNNFHHYILALMGNLLPLIIDEFIKDGAPKDRRQAIHAKFIKIITVIADKNAKINYFNEVDKSQLN